MRKYYVFSKISQYDRTKAVALVLFVLVAIRCAALSVYYPVRCLM